MQVYGDGLYIGLDYGNGDAGVDIQNAFDGEWHQFIWTFGPNSNLFQSVDDIFYELGSDTGSFSQEFEIADVRVYPNKIDASQAWQLYSNSIVRLYDPLWTSSFPEYWVTYKAALVDTYGDGSGEVPDVPLEFFEFGVHGAYADWLRGEGQTDKAVVEERFASEHLERQLEKIHTQAGSPYLWSRFSTHSTRQAR